MALAAKRLAPRASLAVLILAAQLADVMWPVLVAVGIEQVRIDPGNTAFTPLDFVAYPYSHSLLLLMLWGVILGVLTRAHVGGRAAIPLVAGLVVSHWLLDWITHRPDMPLSPGGPHLGLGLWNSVPWTLAVELAMLPRVPGSIFEPLAPTMPSAAGAFSPLWPSCFWPTSRTLAASRHR